jgi:hypothetical protein
MGAVSSKLGQKFEKDFETLLKKIGLKYTKSYSVMTITGLRRIDFVIHSRWGKVIAECKYRDPSGTNAAKRDAATGLFTTMYEYRHLFPADMLIVVVNDRAILEPGNQRYISLLASIGVEVLWYDAPGKPNQILVRKLQELK